MVKFLFIRLSFFLVFFSRLGIDKIKVYGWFNLGFEEFWGKCKKIRE